MKILMIDKYFFIKGGAERYVFEFSNVLKDKGHQIIPFSMVHPQNFPSEYSDYFVSEIHYRSNNVLEKALIGLKAFPRMIYSLEAKKKLELLLEKTKPDIAHLHMIDHQISPSILPAIKSYNIPIIQTVHQYKLVCPNYRFYNPRKNSICEKCLDGKLYHPVMERCFKNSYFTGAMLSIEMGLHRLMKLYANIDLYHVPSRFMGEKLKQGGIYEHKIFKQYYTINLDEFPFQQQFDNYIVYFGRLSEEKGILTLLKSIGELPQVQLKVLGSGPQENELVTYVEDNHIKNVEFMGYKEKDEIKSIIGNAKFVVVPSEWYDNSPLVIYEAFSMGKPVIGSAIGGISELIDDKINGYLFNAQSVEDLKQKISLLWDNDKKVVEFGQNARKKAELEFSPEAHYNKMMTIYNELLNDQN